MLVWDRRGWIRDMTAVLPFHNGWALYEYPEMYLVISPSIHHRPVI
jgi:hypothetical protein